MDGPRYVDSTNAWVRGPMKFDGPNFRKTTLRPSAKQSLPNRNIKVTGNEVKILMLLRNLQRVFSTAVLGTS